MDTQDATAAVEVELTDPEHQLLAAAGTGTLVDLRADEAELDDPAEGASWGVARTVRAEVVVDLLVGTRTPPGGRLRAVRLAGARITGRLDLEAITLACPLQLLDCYLEQAINLNEVQASAVRLPGCHLPGFTGDQLETRGNLELNHGFVATGEVTLLGARIGGSLDLGGATLDNPEGQALFANRLTVDQSMLCGEGFTAIGEVALLGAQIGGSLDLSGATLTNPDGRALSGDGLTVKRNLLFRDGFTAAGEVRLPGARIGGQFSLNGGTLTNPDGRALNAQRLTVEQDMLLCEGFAATGEVSLHGAQIDGQLAFDEATLSNPGRVALHLEEVKTEALFLLPQKPPDGIVDLTAAKVGSFEDDQTTWPASLNMRGFVYDTLENDRVSVRARLRWLLRQQDGYSPQPYEQLAIAYRRDGRDENARRVLIAKQWRRRGRLNPWNWLLYATVGYGYRTWLAVLWLLLLLWAGTNALDRADQAQLLEPAKDNPGQQPTFHPLTYALDLLLPIVSLGQEGAWIPRGWAEWWTWGLILAGWVLTTAVVAGLTGVLKRD